MSSHCQSNSAQRGHNSQQGGQVWRGQGSITGSPSSRSGWRPALWPRAPGHWASVRDKPSGANTPSLPATAPHGGQVADELPNVWLTNGGNQWVGTLAAGGTSEWHFDPALTLPNIQTPRLPAQTRAVITIG